MLIQWKGHACFLVVSQNGTRVLTDPFDEKVGYPLPKVKVDYVTESHQHFDHNAAHLLEGNPTVIAEPGTYEYPDLKIRSVATFHDTEEGAKRGPNTVFILQVDGLNICHLGDLGHPLTPEHVSQIGQVDVLCIPVGGFYTINAETAKKVVAQLNPSIILPMHYRKEPYITMPIAEVDDFLKLFSNVRREKSLEITQESLPDSPQVVVLELA